MRMVKMQTLTYRYVLRSSVCKPKNGTYPRLIGIQIIPLAEMYVLRAITKHMRVELQLDPIRIGNDLRLEHLLTVAAGGVAPKSTTANIITRIVAVER